MQLKRGPENTLEPPLATFGTATGLSTLYTRLALLISESWGYHAKISPENEFALDLALGLITLAVIFNHWESKSIKIYARLSGIAFGVSVGLAFENLPQVALPLGILALGSFAMIYAIDPANSKK